MKKHIPMLMAQHSPDGKSKSANFNRVRLQLGEITALGLEILVVSDIMEVLHIHYRMNVCKKILIKSTFV